MRRLVMAMMIGMASVLAVTGASDARASDVDDVNAGEKIYSIDWSCTVSGELKPGKDTRHMDCRGFSKLIRADSPEEADQKFDTWWPKDHANATYTGRKAPRER